MLRSVLAVIGGFMSMAVVVMIGTMALVTAFIPGGMKVMRERGAAASISPPPLYLTLNIVLSFLAAVIGGWVTLRIATHAPTAHLTALCAVVSTLGVISALTPQNGQQPTWYKFLIPFVGVAGAAASALFASPV